MRLQVNPFAYLARHSKASAYSTELDYNTAIISACKEANIEVIGVTDHYRVQESMGLVLAARSAGLYAFSGFEAVTKDGVHFLCLFDAEKDKVLERIIGECGIRDSNEDSPTGSLDSEELLGAAKSWGARSVLPPMQFRNRADSSRNSPGRVESRCGSQIYYSHAPLRDLLVVLQTASGRF